MVPLDVPIWCQLHDPLPDGNQDPFASTDCGEECAAMVIAYRKGIALPAGVVRTLIRGHQDHGETTAQDLLSVLRLFQIQCDSVEPGPGQVQARLIAAMSVGKPAIVLGNWLSPHVLHWVVAVGYGSGLLVFNEPFVGLRRSEPWDWVVSRYAGDIVVS